MTDQENERALETRDADGARLYSPSAARNRDAICEVFLAHAPARGRVLEIGSGTGEHAVRMAGAARGLSWTPSDIDPAARASVAAWTEASGLANIKAPFAIDASAEWENDVSGPFDLVLSINMIHIAPFEAARGLFRGAGRVLPTGGKLMLYGPFARDGAHISASNEAFDASLKARDPRWGVRDLEHEIAPLAQDNAFARIAVVEMPANNFTVVFAKD
ncbi:MAG: DUF938 domain-containing protein [Pseudomonadota bacterium]